MYLKLLRFKRRTENRVLINTRDFFFVAQLRSFQQRCSVLSHSTIPNITLNSVIYFQASSSLALFSSLANGQLSIIDVNHKTTGSERTVNLQYLFISFKNGDEKTIVQRKPTPWQKKHGLENIKILPLSRIPQIEKKRSPRHFGRGPGFNFLLSN